MPKILKPQFLRSLSFKIYTVLLLMGVVPLFASLILTYNITSFNENLQEEAYQSIDAVSDIYKAWAKAESHSIQTEKNLAVEYLNRALFEAAVEHKLLKIDTNHLSKNSSYLTSLNIILQPYINALIEDTSLVSTTISYNGENLLEYKESNLQNENYKLKTTSIPVQTKLLKSPQEFILHLTFGINQNYTEQYERLGQKRQLHKGLNTLGGNDDGSISNVFQTFYYVMFAIVIVLTICFSLIILQPQYKKIKKLSSATQKVASGDLSVKLIEGQDELGSLAAHFNQMVIQLKNAQEAQANIERMKAWQEVARRLAHELKNPLTPILLAVQQLDKKFEDYQEKPQKYRKLLNDAVDIVNEETTTLTKLVKNFSEFARLPIPTLKPTNLYEFLNLSIHSNPQFQDSASITLEQSTSTSDNPTVPLDSELMRRVFINLVRNSIEAAQNANIKPIIEIVLESPSEQQNIQITLKDNGPGLTEEQLKHIFQPYFTTKSDGTGLGLSIVQKIIHDHNGSIIMQNRTDNTTGAQVIITLPILSSTTSTPPNMDLHS